MILFKIGVLKKKFKKDKWIKLFSKIKDLFDIEIKNIYKEECLILNLGIIGSGNYFVEI